MAIRSGIFDFSASFFGKERTPLRKLLGACLNGLVEMRMEGEVGVRPAL